MNDRSARLMQTYSHSTRCLNFNLRRLRLQFRRTYLFSFPVSPSWLSAFCQITPRLCSINYCVLLILSTQTNGGCWNPSAFYKYQGHSCRQRRTSRQHFRSDEKIPSWMLMETETCQTANSRKAPSFLSWTISNTSTMLIWECRVRIFTNI